MNSYEEVVRRYGKMMHLKIFVDDDDSETKTVYETAAKKHNENILSNIEHVDAGFDLYAPTAISVLVRPESKMVDTLGPRKEKDKICKVDFKVCCSAQLIYEDGRIHNTGYYMYPRSSLSKTPFRLANSVGIIDAGYRGHIMGMFDTVVSSYSIEKYERLVQICAPSLIPIWVEVVDAKEDLGSKTVRGDGGFGSTGNGISS